MKKLAAKATSAKNHVIKHRAKYAAATTASVFVAISIRNARCLNEFFAEKGIDPTEYYCPELFAEINA